MIIVITGGTGSLGQALVKNILEDSPFHVIRILSRDEKKQGDMERHWVDALGAHTARDRLRFLLGDVRDEDRCQRAFSGADFVYHLAALKQVHKLEYNTREAILTNVNGTDNVIKACQDQKVPRAIFISSDKAVEPLNLYGATKTVAERIWVSQRETSKTWFSAVRYGNVLGSRGSVLDIFNALPPDVPLPVTSLEATRFWWTLDQAAIFVLECSRIMKGFEIFVPRLKACDMATFCNAFAPNREIKITGLTKGEKMHETIVSKNEKYVAYDEYGIISDEGSFGTSFTSDNADQFTVNELRKLINA